MNTVQDNLMYCDLVSVNGIIHKVGVCGNYFRIIDAEGIPITPEILENNGWYFGLTSDEEDAECGLGGTYERHWTYDEGNGEISLTFPDFTNSGMLIIDDQCFNRRIEFLWNNTLYVHEMQNALRLCGLNEIADNFKV